MHSSNYSKAGLRPIHELAAEICTLTGHLNAANHRLLVLIAEYVDVMYQKTARSRDDVPAGTSE